MKFLSRVITNLVKDRNLETPKIVLDAYSEILAPYHNWALRRMVVGFGGKTMPTRKAFMESFAA